MTELQGAEVIALLSNLVDFKDEFLAAYLVDLFNFTLFSAVLLISIATSLLILKITRGG